MPLLHPHHILHPTPSSRTQRDIQTLDREIFSEKPEKRQNHLSSLACPTVLTWLFLSIAMEPNKTFADQLNFDSHSNQDTLDFSAHRESKKKKPPPPGEPVPPPPPGRRRHSGNTKNPPSLLLLSHQLQPSGHIGTNDFGITSGFHFTKPLTSLPLETLGNSGVIPTPSSLFLLVLAARHRRRRMTYGVCPNHGRFHHHFVRSPPGANHQSRGIP